MFKKMGLSLLLAFAMLVSTFYIGNISHAQAAPACRTLAECREREREARNNIAEIIEQEEELGEELEIIRTEITSMRNEIAIVDAEIAGMEAELATLRDEIYALRESMIENAERLEITEARIEELLEEVSRRMRVAQRSNHRNSFIVMITEAESFVDLIRHARTFSRIAEGDADAMAELAELMEAQENLLILLEEQHETAQVSAERLVYERANVEREQSRLLTLQYALSAREYDMLERMYALGLNRVNEEEMLASIAEAEEILRRTPPTPVVTNATVNRAGIPQTPNESGLAHPMPGARVSSEFGPRWGGHHAGIDLEIFSNPRAPILASASGTVTIATYGSGMGWYVVISHLINGQRVDTLYAHLRYAPPVSAGDIVTQGQVIGTKGSTGFSTGAHLHFEVHPGGFSWNRGVDPRRWINF